MLRHHHVVHWKMYQIENSIFQRSKETYLKSHLSYIKENIDPVPPEFGGLGDFGVASIEALPCFDHTFTAGWHFKLIPNNRFIRIRHQGTIDVTLLACGRPTIG